MKFTQTKWFLHKGLFEKLMSAFVDAPPLFPSNFRKAVYWGITSDVIFIGGVNFFYSSVAEGELSHPVHTSSYASGQAQVGTSGSSVESVCAKIICAEQRKRKRDLLKLQPK